MAGTWIYSNSYPGFREFAAWMITILVLAAGWKYVQEFLSWILSKLYQYFVLQNTSGI